MRILRKQLHISRILIAGALVGMTGCGSSSPPVNPGSFSAIVASPSDHASIAVASITLSPDSLVGGAATEVTVNLNRPAPGGGIAVELRNSDASLITTPAVLNIPAGQTSATVPASTSRVGTAAKVAITAVYGNSVAGTSLNLASARLTPARQDSAAAPEFTLAIQPSTVTIAPGHSASAKVTTTVASGYDHALDLTVSVPAGVSVHFNPKVIPAPGAGVSTATIKVPSTGISGTHAIHVTASDGTTSAKATLTLKVPASDPGATFQGCRYQSNGNSYQGVTVSVANPGTYPFNAILYYGTTCDPNNWADQIGFGTDLNFGGFDWIFWFNAFPNQNNMSALWSVGSDKSQCVNYEVVPDC
jgi:hypothetical protein